MEGELKKKREQETKRAAARQLRKVREQERERCAPHWGEPAEFKLKDDNKNSGAEGWRKRRYVTVLWLSPVVTRPTAYAGWIMGMNLCALVCVYTGVCVSVCAAVCRWVHYTLIEVRCKKLFPRQKLQLQCMMYVLENSNDVILLGDCIMQLLVFTSSSAVKNGKLSFCFTFKYYIFYLGILLLVVL